MILFGYILKEFFKVFFIILFSMTSIFWIGDFFANMGSFLKSDATFIVIVKYFLFKTPIAFYYIIPFAVLASSMYFFGKLNANYEMIAFRTLKVDKLVFYRILSGIGVIFYLLLLINNEILIPKSFYMSKVLKNVYFKKRSNFAVYEADKIWYKKGNYIFKIDFANFDRGFMRGITLFRFNNNFDLIERIDAFIGIYSKNKWTLKEVEINVFNKDMSVKREFKEKYDLPVQIDRDDFVAISTESKYLTLNQTLNIVKSLKATSIDTVKYKTELINKIVYPFICVVFLFFGFILNLRNPRERGGVASIIYSVVLGFVILFLQNFFINLGYAKIIPFFAAPLITFIIAFFIFIFLNKKISY